MSTTEDKVETAGPPAGNATSTTPPASPPTDVKKEIPVSGGTPPSPPADDTVAEKEAGESIAITGPKIAKEILRGPNGEEYPTKEELDTLRRVKGKIHWIIYTVAFCELCERFAYYGTTQVFVNFIAEPLPPGYSGTGAAGTYGQPGALGMGQQASTGITLFNSFWAYIMPLFGAYLADTFWGKFKTINVAM